MKRAYRPSFWIMASLVVHGGALGLISVWPSGWVDALIVVGLNHLFLTLSGLIPQSGILGPNLRSVTGARSGVLYLTFDDGPDPLVTPRVLDILERHGLKATFFLIGERVERYPEIARQIVAQGHGVANHSLCHEWGFAFKGLKALREDLKRTQGLIHEASGVRPIYFRAPFGIRSPLLEPVLCDLGLGLVSWTHRGYDTRCPDQRKVLARLTSGLAPGAVLLLHDGRTRGARLPGSTVLELLPALLEEVSVRGYVSAALPGSERLCQPKKAPG